MKTALPGVGAIENSLENTARCAVWRLCIIEGAEEHRTDRRVVRPGMYSLADTPSAEP
jgi:hypothetical protein